jgi:hypothetical protein
MLISIDSTERNACESTLLRLPPEIRNRIWAYALAIKKITLVKESDDWLNDIDEDEVEEEHMEAYHALLEDSEISWARANITPGLQMLLVCRHIYAEAALLPFSQNLLSFSGVESDLGQEWVQKRLLKGQRSAIQGVELGCADRHGNLSRAIPELEIVRLRHVCDLVCGCKAISRGVRKSFRKGTVKVLVVRKTR